MGYSVQALGGDRKATCGRKIHGGCRHTAAIRSHDDSLTRRGNWPRRHLHHRDNKPAIVSGQFTGMAVMGVQTRPAIVQAVRTQSAGSTFQSGALTSVSERMVPALLTAIGSPSRSVVGTEPRTGAA